MLQKVIGVAVLYVLCGLAGSAKAQVFLEEGKVSLVVSGGERVNKSIVVHNTSAEDLDAKVYWEDFEYQPPYDGTKIFLPAGTTPVSAARWVTYSPQQLVLPSFGKQQINYTIDVPQRMTEGHYGVLFIERINKDIKDASGLNVITRVGCLFFIEPKDKVKKATLQDFSISPQNRLSGRFVNQGNIILIPRMTYYIMGEGDMVNDRGEVKKIYVPPGGSAAWEITLPDHLNAGRHTLIINSDLEEGDVVVKEIELNKDASGKWTIKNVQN
jgi:hypothetical protein